MKITNRDRSVAERLTLDAWMTAHRPDRSWETYAKQVAAALAEARGESGE